MHSISIQIMLRPPEASLNITSVTIKAINKVFFGFEPEAICPDPKRLRARVIKNNYAHMKHLPGSSGTSSEQLRPV